MNDMNFIKRNEKIDYLKAVGIISIVIGHAMNTDIFYSPTVEYIRRFVYVYHITVFFFVSGLLYQKQLFPSRFIYKIFKKNYRKYFCVVMGSIILYPIWYYCNIIDTENIGSIIKRFILSVLFMPAGFFTGALWFIPLFVISLSLYCILDCKIHNSILKGIMFFQFGILGMFLSYIKQNIKLLMIICNCCYLDKALIMLPVIYIGYLVQNDKLNSIIERITKLGMFPIYGGCITILNFITGLQVEITKDLYYGYVWFYPMTFLGILFCISLSSLSKSGRRCSHIMQEIGSRSFEVMAFHFMAFKATDLILAKTIYRNFDNMKSMVKYFPISFSDFRWLYIICGIGISYSISKLCDCIKGKISSF